MNHPVVQNFSPMLPKFCIRSALPRDVAPFAPHFQMAFQFPTDSKLFVIQDISGIIRGGGYVLLSGSTEGNAIFDLHIFRQEDFPIFGRELLTFFKKLSAARGRKFLSPSKSIPENSAFAELLDSQSAQVTRVLARYEVETEKLLANFEPVYERLLKRRKIPKEMKLVPLSEAPFVATRELVRRTIGSNSLALERQLADQYFCETTSKVVTVESSVAGAILVRVKNQTAEIIYLAVDSNRRNSWVYAVLCREFLVNARQNHYRTICLKTFHPAIRQSAERGGGKIIGREFSYRLDNFCLPV